MGRGVVHLAMVREEDIVVAILRTGVVGETRTHTIPATLEDQKMKQPVTIEAAEEEDMARHMPGRHPTTPRPIPHPQPPLPAVDTSLRHDSLELLPLKHPSRLPPASLLDPLL